MKILVIEDDYLLAQALQQTLRQQNYIVDVAFEGQTGLELAENFEYDLIVLDVVLPNQDGISICRQLRSQRNPALILLLTVQGESRQKVAGFEAGADDYLTKPVDIPEFLARIRALLRRGEAIGPSILEWQGLKLDLQNSRFTLKDQLLSLTAKEYELLELFMRNPQRIFSSDYLVEKLWTMEEIPTENAVRAHVTRLRRKLDQAGQPDVIETVHGLGYRLRQVCSDELTTALTPTTLNPIDYSAKIPLSPLWPQCRSQYGERALDLQQAIAALIQDQQGPYRQQAQDQAHTLAGSLGSFGLEQASELALQIDKWLKIPEKLTDLDLQRLQAWAQGIQYEIQTVTEDPVVDLVSPPKVHPIQLLIVDDDLALARQLASLSSTYGIQPQIETEIAAAQVHLAQEQPDVVLLDLGFPNHPDAGFDLLKAFSAQWPHIPVIVFTAHDQFGVRVQAARLGSCIFLQKPLAPTTVLNTVLQAYTQADPTDLKLMMVEDDTQTSKTIQSLLEPLELQLISGKNVRWGWKKLPDYQPDAILISTDLPDSSGFDLCRVIRHEPYWSDLPVIFLVSNPDPATVNRMCAVGATTWIGKPIVEADLICRILRGTKGTHRDRQNLTSFPP